MTRFGSQRGAGGAATLMMIVAFIGVGGFLYWLSVKAASTEVAVAEEQPVEDDGIPRVAFTDFAADPTPHAGQQIRLTEVPITSAFGSSAFWTEVGGQPYLVHVGQEGAMIPASGMADIVGTIASMSDSVLGAWEAAGHVVSEGDKAAASFAESFFEAESVEFQADPGEGEAGSGGA